MQIIKKRKDYIKASKGKRWITPAFILLACNNENNLIFDDNKKDNSNNKFRFGFTASKKIGNAVKRNKAKRRLKGAVRKLDDFYNKKLGLDNNIDFVLIARKKILDYSFELIKKDLEFASNRLVKKISL